MLFYKKIVSKLIDKKISISIAESCTGGLLSSTLTKVPGISKIFNMGLITYSNKSKKFNFKNTIKLYKKIWSSE